MPLVALAGGICISQVIRFSPGECWAALIALSLITAVAQRYATIRTTRAAAWIACLAAGILLDTVRRPGPPPELDAASGETVILSGCVVEPGIFAREREHFTLELAPRANVQVSLALNDGELPPSLSYGQRVEVEAKVRRPRNFGNPGAFDYVRYLARQNVYWSASARRGAPITVLPGRCGERWLAVVYALRVAALTRLEALYPGDDYAAAMMEAILLGESSKLEKVWTDHFRRTGTFHALVISGLHVTVLAGVLLFLLRLCMVNEMTALVIAAVAAWLYAAVSGWSAPVIRAAGGFTLYLVGRYFYRRGRILNLLAAVGIGYLVYDPGQMFDASFQLSFLSVAAIGILAVPILERTSGRYAQAARELADRGRDPRMPRHAAALRVELRLLAETVFVWTRIPERYTLASLSVFVRLLLWLYEMVTVSAVVQIALALPMAFYFHRVSLTGLSANILIVPLLSGVVPIGFAAIFTGFRWVAWLAKLLLVWAEAVANWHVKFEPATRITDPPVLLAVAFVAALILAGVTLRRNNSWRLPACAGTLGLFGALLWAQPRPELSAGLLELTAIDVGQGDSLFVAAPDGHTMLVDAGGILSFARRPAAGQSAAVPRPPIKPRIDIGEDVVSPYLWGRRIRRVDVVAVSHAHEDHIGGLVAVLENFRPRELWTGATPASEQWLSIERRARELGIRIIRRQEGDQIQWGAARLDVIGPPADYEAGSAAKNNDSLALRIRLGEHTFLLMGDMEKQIEYRLAAGGALTRATVLKVAHHGSKTSSTEEFLAATQPAIALISAGFQNSFRHPHPEVLNRLHDHHTEVLRTDQSGLLTVRSDGHRLWIDTNGGQAAHPGLTPVFP